MMRIVERNTKRREVDAGFSLVEMVVTISLVGIAMIPIMLGAWTLVKTSSNNRTTTKIETVLANAGDRVNRANGACEYSQYLNAAKGTANWNITASYQWYEPNSGTWQPAGCPTLVPYDSDLVQLVEITVTSPDGQLSRMMQVVKSKI